MEKVLDGIRLILVLLLKGSCCEKKAAAHRVANLLQKRFLEAKNLHKVGNHLDK